MPAKMLLAPICGTPKAWISVSVASFVKYFLTFEILDRWYQPLDTNLLTCFVYGGIPVELDSRHHFKPVDF